MLNILRIQNNHLWERYNNEKYKMEAKLRNKTCSVELMLFHGCKRDATESIKTKGFDIKYAKAGLYGTGLYFAINSKYSTSGYQTINNDGTCSLFVAKVLIGDPYFTG